MRLVTRTSESAGAPRLAAAARPVTGRGRRASGPGSGPPIHPSAAAAREDDVDAVLDADAARRAAAASSSRRTRAISRLNLAGIAIAASWSTERSATSATVSNQLARRVSAMRIASASPRPMRSHTRVANASRVSGVGVASAYASASPIDASSASMARTRRNAAARGRRYARARCPSNTADVDGRAATARSNDIPPSPRPRICRARRCGRI